jgi:hypothetical protein
VLERVTRPSIAVLAVWAIAALVTGDALISPAGAQTPTAGNPVVSDTPGELSPGSTPTVILELRTPATAPADPGGAEERGRFDRWVRPLAVISILLVVIAGLYVYRVIRKGL